MKFIKLSDGSIINRDFIIRICKSKRDSNVTDYGLIMAHYITSYHSDANYSYYINLTEKDYNLLHDTLLED